MTVSELGKSLELDILTMPCPDREIDGVYIGDLLSWVMGRAEHDNVWVTIMSNINVIAVASLSDVACVLLSEGVTLAHDVLALASEKNINVLSTPLSTYDVAVKLGELLR